MLNPNRLGQRLTYSAAVNSHGPRCANRAETPSDLPLTKIKLWEHE